MYYRLDSDDVRLSGQVRKDANKHETLQNGAIIDETKLKLPWPYTVVLEDDEELELGDFYPDVGLMSKRLVAALQEAGVDNLQTFPAVLNNSRNGETIDDFLAVNVVGLVAAADLGASSTSQVADVKYFHKLVIDPKRATDLLMFRLAESRMDVIVEERVARAVGSGDFPTVVVEPLDGNGEDEDDDDDDED
jgi:hypothetical protein